MSTVWARFSDNIPFPPFLPDYDSTEPLEVLPSADTLVHKASCRVLCLDRGRYTGWQGTEGFLELPRDLLGSCSVPGRPLQVEGQLED